VQLSPAVKDIEKTETVAATAPPLVTARQWSNMHEIMMRESAPGPAETAPPAGSDEDEETWHPRNVQKRKVVLVLM
jgi:hypothetical protein